MISFIINTEHEVIVVHVNWMDFFFEDSALELFIHKSNPIKHALQENWFKEEWCNYSTKVST